MNCLRETPLYLSTAKLCPDDNDDDNNPRDFDNNYQQLSTTTITTKLSPQPP
jgi:hypothetical protein